MKGFDKIMSKIVLTEEFGDNIVEMSYKESYDTIRFINRGYITLCQK